MRRFLGKSLLCPTHSQKTPFPATLHAILRVNKTPQNSRRCEGTAALDWVLDQTLVSLKDFLTLKQRVDHYLYDHPDVPPPRECLDLIMICIATLDGARAVGFDVGDLEGELEKSLNEIERRTA